MRMLSHRILPNCWLLGVVIANVPIGAVQADVDWKNPLVKLGKLNSPLVEVTPFVFQERLYRLENWRRHWESADLSLGEYQNQQVRIRDVETNQIVSTALVGHSLGVAFVWQDRVYVFAREWSKKKAGNTPISMVSSDDLLHWTKPVVVLRAKPGETFFNVSVCRGKDRFVLLVESDDPTWPYFTFKYFQSDDLNHWKPVPNAIYGRDKFVGGPALYREGEYYYTLYAERLGDNHYETRITRSQDLVHWQDAPAGRPLVTYNPKNKIHPLRPANIRERNASDAEVCLWKGKTLVYYTGGDQHFCGDLQWAEFNGTPRELFERFFEQPGEQDTVVPEHTGDWTPVLIRGNNASEETPVDAGCEDARRLFVPSARQQRYQEAQLGAFVHFGPATFNQGEFLDVPDPSIFNPTALDAEQWVLAAKSFGAKHIVLTAKHHNGFCLWPTESTDYSVKASPWKDGQGDVVRELAEACKKHGLRLGLYLSACDKHEGCWSTPDPIGKRKLVGSRKTYFPVYMQQVKELMSNYGEVAVFWNDGAYNPLDVDVLDPKTGHPVGSDHARAVSAYVHALQPMAVVYGLSFSDVRWSGSEAGWAPYPLWNVVQRGTGRANWLMKQAEGWFIPEANIYTRASWFWKPDSDPTLKSVDALMTAYDQSIGRGANLLINMTPDTTGRIPEAEVQRLANFGKAWQQRFENPIATTDSRSGGTSPSLLELDLGGEATVQWLVMEENLADGQRVLAYEIEAFVDGGWQKVAAGQSIGRKRIEKLDPAITATRLRLRITKALAKPTIRLLAAYSP